MPCDACIFATRVAIVTAPVVGTAARDGGSLTLARWTTRVVSGARITVIARRIRDAAGVVDHDDAGSRRKLAHA